MQDFHVPEISASPLPSGASQRHSVAGGGGGERGGVQMQTLSQLDGSLFPFLLHPYLTQGETRHAQMCYLTLSWHNLMR